MKQKNRLKIEYVKINKLQVFDKNPRKEKKQGIKKLVDSFQKFGWTNPILVQKSNNRIIAGHQRLKGAIKEGHKEVPVVYLDMNDEDATLYNIADNKLSEEVAGWDKKLLAGLYMDLGEDYESLKVTGINPKEFDDLMDKFGTQVVIDSTKIPGEEVDMSEVTYYPFWLVIRGKDNNEKVREEIEKVLKKTKISIELFSSEEVFE